MTHTSLVNERLEALPRRIGTPLKRLLEVGQLSEDVIGNLIDAGELAGDSSHLLGFAAGYLHLQSTGVPVKDVIGMARAQKRRIRLDWSARRWKDEHDRLSRAETLARLSESKVIYDLSKYREHFPHHIKGYLIGTSRRLGMEGLRQRHCIASYHQQILAGYCAIASVFLDGRRWTVQLALTGKPETPLRIAQIKTRFNENPSREQHEQIYALFGIETNSRASPSAEQPSKERFYMENLRRILPILRGQGVKEVSVSFDGCGDSGSIDSVQFEPQGFDGTAHTVEVLLVTPQFDASANGWVNVRETLTRDLNEAIEELTNDYLDETGVDWYNNDGGYGRLVIDVADGTVELEINGRYTESNTEYARTHDILSGDEVAV